MQKIYFNAIPLLLSDSENISSEGIRLASWDKEVITNAIEDLEASGKQELQIVHPDLEMVIEAIKNQFTVIQAAGGLTLSDENEVLLIFRRGKWDLPKGKLDEGESLEVCAVREVEEETGLQGVELGEFLQETYHTYKENDQDILKETHWYLMKSSKQDLHPQTEEDIQECKWVPLTEVTTYYNNMQPSVKDVIEVYLNTVKG
jgi:8-oxo-dGTP pyrophosphatase MutT (NUDIX family)